MNFPLDTLIAYWTKEGPEIKPGLLHEDIKQLEADLSFHFEPGFNQYLQRANGFADFDSDKEWFCFWEQKRIIEENNNSRHPKEVVWFADHSLNLCCFGFHRVDKKVYTHYDHRNELMHIADSFIEFVNLYLQDPYQLLR